MINGRLTPDELVDRIWDEEVKAYLRLECFKAMLQMYRETREQLEFTEALLADVLREGKQNGPDD